MFLKFLKLHKNSLKIGPACSHFVLTHTSNNKEKSKSKNRLSTTTLDLTLDNECCALNVDLNFKNARQIYFLQQVVLRNLTGDDKDAKKSLIIFFFTKIPFA